MKKSIFVSVSLALALTALVLLAADIDGKWTAQTQGKNGPETQTLTVKADGSALTGTLDNGGKGGPAEISDGKMDGDKVSFKIVREFGGNKIEQTFNGTLGGGELKLQMAGGRGGPVDMVFKK